MANQLFEQFGNQANNGMTAFIDEVKQMQETFKGDPRAEVERLLDSGKLSQADFNKYAQMANQIMQFMK